VPVLVTSEIRSPCMLADRVPGYTTRWEDRRFHRTNQIKKDRAYRTPYGTDTDTDRTAYGGVIYYHIDPCIKIKKLDPCAS
jgi:hypothetical protein